MLSLVGLLSSSNMDRLHATTACGGSWTGGDGVVLDASSFGLPSAACPISAQRVHALRVRHRQNREAGRILHYCNPDAFGNYLFPLPMAILVSLLLDLALVLDVEQSTFGSFICPPRRGINWRVTKAESGASMPLVPMRESMGACRLLPHLPTNASEISHVSGEIRRASTAMRVGNAIFEQRKLHLIVAHPANRARLKSILGAELLAFDNWDGCLLQLVLSPCQRTLEIIQRMLLLALLRFARHQTNAR